MLLRVEHARLVLFNVLQDLNLLVVASDALILDLSLHLFIFDVGLGELLPIVINLLVDQTVGFL